MKIKIVNLLIATALFSVVSYAEETPDSNATTSRLSALKEKTSHFALGWSINNFSGNYGLGLEMQSPAFFNDIVHLRLSGAYNWVQGTRRGANSETWSPYGLFRLGAFSSSFILGTPIRGYGGGGLVLLTPTDSVSTKNVEFGGYGLVGLEFFLADKNFPLYMELGGIGTGAQADQLERSQIYANGFLMSWGFRYFL